MKKGVIVLIVILSGLFLRNEIENKNRINIGVVSTLSGEGSSIGIAMLNGIVMAAEEFNRDKKFYEKKVSLIIRDDKNDALEAKKAATELIDAGVVAILGPALSEAGIAVSEVGNERKKLVVSPTVGTTKLSGKDDYFIRISPPVDKNAISLADISKDYFNMKKILLIYNRKNSAYTESFRDSYIEAFTGETKGENNVYIKTTSDRIKSYFPAIKDEIDGVVIIANPIDTAEITQNIKKIKGEMQILVSGWALHQNFITYGGKYAEGVYIAYYYDDYFDKDIIYLDERFKDFKIRYTERYNEKSDAFSLYGYESFNILVHSIKRSGSRNSDKLKEEVLSPESEEYFLQPGKFDKYGDGERGVFIFQVKDKKFQKVESNQNFRKE
ncbi:ABC transporter substrate-binding protein [uncultured Ilyobacter sp.]|uniref:ABC transporter substrate-binding protein n=1 Tax=uncultured Ilyobacter sp. TaxID=544433 RepID=UPI0029F5C011|nr:ABC transporter substrate-binding protein [uncultured Ilyobacter sp.]